MLRVTDLSYAYGANPVLGSISFEVEAGVLTALVGRNGAGKSTLLRCLAGWTTPLNGTIELNGARLRGQERTYQSQVVLVPDTPDFYDELTAWDHLQLVSQLYRVAGWQERADSLLRQFDLYEARRAFPFTFSRGMRHKLALCMALLVQPPLLLLDEPFGPLDSVASRLLWKHLQDYCVAGRSVLFSSHTFPDGEHPDQYLTLREQQIMALEPSRVTDLADVLDG